MGWHGSTAECEEGGAGPWQCSRVLDCSVGAFWHSRALQMAMYIEAWQH